MRSTAPSLLLMIPLAVGAGFSACFQAPSADVLFACEPSDPDRDDCPDGYGCEADGCCHKDGSDVEESFGDCALQGATGGMTETGEGTDSDEGTESGGTESGGTETGGTGTGG